MDSSSLLQLLLITLIFCPSGTADALVLHLPSGRVKCISEDIPAGALSLAVFRIVADEAEPQTQTHHKISGHVMDPKGDSIHRADGVESGQFPFVATDSGKYTVCFWSPQFQLDAAVAVDFEWRTGIAARDWQSIAKKGKIDAMEVQLKILEGSINSIHEEMIFLSNREEESRRLNEATTSRMGLLGILSFIVCMGVAGLQLWHLKTFFERQKIL